MWTFLLMMMDAGARGIAYTQNIVLVLGSMIQNFLMYVIMVAGEV